MATPSPYRSLPAARRIALLTHVLTANPETRALFIQRLVARGGGFRAVTLLAWPVDRLAREVVRGNVETSQDELDLLQLLYVDLEPAIQISFLDAASVRHELGKMDETLSPPYADAESVRRAASVVHDQYGADGVRYLRTLARYSLDGWPGIDGIVAGLEA